jgi:peptidoglycan hydrolase-like protein with peptidoglycan-binding domain
MRHNLLRLGFALLVAGLVFPAGAAARQDTADRPDQSRPGHSQVAMPAGWSAGPVHRWSGYSRPGGSRRVRELQRRLDRLGYEPGPVDGLFGPRTERATRRFQARHGLRIDAIVGRETLDALRLRDRHRHAVHPAPAPAPSPVTTVVPSYVPPAHTTAPAPRATAPGPDLPMVPLLIGVALLGVAAFVSSYLRTGARIRRTEAERMTMESSRRRRLATTPQQEARP